MQSYDQFINEKVSDGLKSSLEAKNPHHPFLKAFKSDKEFNALKTKWDSGKREDAAREFRAILTKMSNKKLGTSLLLMVAGASLTAAGYDALTPPPPDPIVPPPVPPTPPTGEEYVIKKGDSIWKIAKGHLPKGASNADILKYTRQIASQNGMNVKLIDGVLTKIPGDPDLIFPGGKLILNKFAAALKF